MQDHHWRWLASLSIPLILAACGTTQLSSPPSEPPPRQASIPKKPSSVPALPPAGSGKGGYYKDDGPGDNIPDGLLDTPDAEPRVEPYAKATARPYVVFGKRYTPITDERPYKERGVGSWYGKKFHGQKTSSGELYDMYKMSAAHPTLPIPSYARVTNLDNNRQVIVRVNDRGPFHSGRIIDLSYTAALKLGYLGKGSGKLEVERLLPEEIERMASNRRSQQAEASGIGTPNRQNGIPAASAPAKDGNAGDVAAAYANPQPDTAAIKPAVFSAGPSAAPGFYIQLGAYGQTANAEAARVRMMQMWSSAMPPIEVAESGALYRLQSGPFATRAEAAAAALQLQNAGTAKPMIVQR
ncbi:septal ring lytic transglycosylase RlpA family protein [Noviherbaspirillum cavernae]|uniref:Endolytic peptidoglycan transglycosylase RlpA n=1 Tax=Noviherbaspirillum cavernae TaxID=2320862 RepID=A0A418X5I8_9BURK|nr:septal ring lytic transglycosylase RlpA family protein [Noviherbaspirillum cavernae]RJG07753.1 septal ring lytic transglycosylase RlpA family protein [Noviherbaspirillum cavernae]